MSAWSALDMVSPRVCATRRYMHSTVSKLLVTVILVVALGGCAGTTVIPLNFEAQPVEIAAGDVDRSQYTYLGEVQGTAKSTDIAAANANARNDLRNKAAAMGATVVVLDTNTAGNAMDWTGRTQVVLSGRAFRPTTAQ